MDRSIDRLMKHAKNKLEENCLHNFDIVFKKPSKRFPKGAVVAEYNTKKSTSKDITWNDIWLFVPEETPDKASLICRYHMHNKDNYQKKALALITNNLDVFFAYLFSIQKSKPWSEYISIGSEHEDRDPIRIPINILTKDSLLDYIEKISAFTIKCLDIRTVEPKLFEDHYSGDLFPDFIKDTLCYYNFLSQEYPSELVIDVLHNKDSH